ncbi:MAG: Single-stranded DNA-binding protein [Burkholderia sp.]|jgi:single-strand DNA-binding protein
MASVNKAFIIGNLGRDPETRFSADGNTAITTINVATTRRYRNQDKELVSETEWHRIVLFSRLAEIARDYLHKGSQVFIEGRIRTRKYTGKDGIDRYATEIVAEQMQLLDRRADSQQNADQNYGSPRPSQGGFESQPRQAPQRQSQPAQQSAAAKPAGGDPYDQLDDQDVPF